MIDMGLLRDYLIKDKDKKFWVSVILNILIILALLYFAHYQLIAFKEGVEYGMQNCQVLHGMNISNISGLI